MVKEKKKERKKKTIKKPSKLQKLQRARFTLKGQIKGQHALMNNWLGYKELTAGERRLILEAQNLLRMINISFDQSTIKRKVDLIRKIKEKGLK